MDILNNVSILTAGVCILDDGAGMPPRNDFDDAIKAILNHGLPVRVGQFLQQFPPGSPKAKGAESIIKKLAPEGVQEEALSNIPLYVIVGQALMRLRPSQATLEDYADKYGVKKIATFAEFLQGRKPMTCKMMKKALEEHGGDAETVHGMLYNLFKEAAQKSPATIADFPPAASLFSTDAEIARHLGHMTGKKHPDYKRAIEDFKAMLASPLGPQFLAAGRVVKKGRRGAPADGEELEDQGPGR